jgi:hypothetical protein
MHLKSPPSGIVIVVFLVFSVVAAILTYGSYALPNESPNNPPLTDASVDTVVTRQQPASLVSAVRQPAPVVSIETDDKPTLGDSKADSLPSIRVTVNDPLLTENIKSRQSAIRQHLEVAHNPHSSEREVVGALIATANLSVLTMYDIEGKARVIPEMVVDLDAKQMDPQRHRARQSRWTSNGPDVYRITSGGATYEIPRGEFPEFDLVESARKLFSSDIPVGELPIHEILARAELVLSHEVL